jgi:hypothetical protein
VDLAGRPVRNPNFSRCPYQLLAYQLCACQPLACPLSPFAVSALQGSLPQASQLQASPHQGRRAQASGQTGCSATATAGLVVPAVLRLASLHGALALIPIQIDPAGYLATNAADLARINRIPKLRFGFPKLVASESNRHDQ